MASKSHLTYSARASQHKEPMVKRLFELAETKKSNVIVSADLTNTPDLLDLADRKEKRTYSQFCEFTLLIPKRSWAVYCVV